MKSGSVAAKAMNVSECLLTVDMSKLYEFAFCDDRSMLSKMLYGVTEDRSQLSTFNTINSHCYNNRCTHVS